MKLSQLTEDVLYLSEHGYEYECDTNTVQYWLYIQSLGIQIEYHADSESRKCFYLDSPDDCECSHKIIRKPNIIDEFIVSIKEIDKIFVEIWDWSCFPCDQHARDLVENLINNSRL